jgi:hypothetical protein
VGVSSDFIAWVTVLVGFHPDETLFFINTLPTQQFC